MACGFIVNGKAVFNKLLALVWPGPVTLSQLLTNSQVNADYEPDSIKEVLWLFYCKKLLFFLNSVKKSDKHYPCTGLIIRKSRVNEKFTKGNRVFLTGL